MDTKKLRQKILDFAIRGKLVPQDPSDEPASVLIEKIRAEKERLIKEKKIKRDKNESHIYRSDKSYYEKFADGTVKCVDEDMPFEISESWEWVRLGEIAYVASGSTPAKSAFTITGIPYLKMYNLKHQEIDFDFCPQYITETVHNGQLNRSKTQIGDLIMNIVGPPLGKLAIIPKWLPQCNFNQAAVLIRVYGMKEINKWFFYYLSEMSEISSISTKGSAGQDNISVSQSRNMKIPLPPLAEQERIVAEIEHLFSLIDIIEENKLSLEQFIKQTKFKILDLAIRGKLISQNLNDEPASVLLERIKSEYPENKKKTQKTRDNSHYTDSIEIPDNWKDTTMQEICYLSDGKKIDGKALPYLDVKYLRGKSDTNVLLSGKYVKKNTFLILVDGENSGEIFLTKENGYQGSTFKILNINNNVNEEFVFKLLQKEQVTFKESKVGSAIPHLNKKLFRELLVFLPPLAEQNRIVKKIEKIFSFLDGISNSIKA